MKKIVYVLLLAGLSSILLLAGCGLFGSEADDGSEESIDQEVRVLFVSDESGTSQLYSMKPDGSDVTQITSDPDFPIFWAAASPDGQKILVGGPDPHEAFRAAWGIYLMDPVGSDIDLLIEDDPDGFDLDVGTRPFVWSPDSRQIIFQRVIGSEFSRVFPILVNCDGTNDRPLTETTEPRRITDWSSDGQYLLGSKYIKELYNNNSQIFKMNLDGEIVKIWGDSTTSYGSPAFSPAGDRIAFSVRDSIDSKFYLSILDPVSGKMMNLTGLKYEQLYNFSWSNTRNLILATAWSPNPNSRPNEFHYKTHILVINPETDEYEDINPFPRSHTTAMGWLEGK